MQQGGALVSHSEKKLKVEWEKTVKKFLTGIGAGIMGIGALASPVSAQEVPGLSSVETTIDSVQFPALPGSSAEGVTDQAAAAVRNSIPQELIPDAAYALFPWLAQSRVPAPAPTPAPTPVLRNCSPTSTPEVRPGFIILYCGDAHSTLGKITWHSWGIDGASGTARLGEKTCVPSCAEGGFTYRTVNFTLGRVEWHGGEPRFTRAYLEGREYRIG